MGGSEQRRARLHFGYTRICLDLRRLDLGGGGVGSTEGESQETRQKLV